MDTTLVIGSESIINMKISISRGGRLLGGKNQPKENTEDSRFTAAIDWWEPCIRRLYYHEDTKGNVTPLIFSTAKTILTETTVRRNRNYDHPRRLIQANKTIRDGMGSNGPFNEYLEEYANAKEGRYDIPDKAQKIIPRGGRPIQYVTAEYQSDDEPAVAEKSLPRTSKSKPE